MKQFMCTFFWGLFVFAIVHGQPQTLSPQAEISLLSVTPGAELYSTFGHSAIRVEDPAYGFDEVYNWGTFDFDTPNFYGKFIQGKLLYTLNPEPYKYFENGNMMEERTTTRTVLNFSAEERQRFYELLKINLKPENRDYKYDFFYDNCATRIRDMVAATFDYQLTWDSTLYNTQDKTMRQLLQTYMEDKPWSWFGMQLVLGIPTDKKARLEDYMFLPDHLRTTFLKTRISPEKPLTGAENQRPSPPFPKTEFKSDFLTSPMFILSLIAILGLLSMTNPKTARIFDGVFWFVLGFLGLLFAFLWFATDHGPCAKNMNLLWALPTHLLVFWRSRKTSWVDAYFVGTGIFAALFLVFFKWAPQDFPMAVLPIVALVVVKGIWGRWKQSENRLGV